MSAFDRLPLNSLRVFEAVATAHSFSDTAEALSVTPAAVSMQIKSLEDYLQVALFRRNARSIELTAEGESLLPSVRIAARHPGCRRLIVRHSDAGHSSATERLWVAPVSTAKPGPRSHRHGCANG